MQRPTTVVAPDAVRDVLQLRAVVVARRVLLCCTNMSASTTHATNRSVNLSSPSEPSTEHTKFRKLSNSSGFLSAKQVASSNERSKPSEFLAQKIILDSNAGFDIPRKLELVCTETHIHVMPLNFRFAVPALMRLNQDEGIGGNLHKRAFNYCTQAGQYILI